MIPRPAAVLAALGAVLLGLGGCAGPVAVPDPAPTGEVATVCTAVLGALPAAIDDNQRRTTEPGPFTAAWGKPAITLRCGVPKPPTLDATSQCFEVNGVDWFAEEATTGYLFTTIGRTAYVEVAVPADYAPEANVLVDVAAAVSTHDPLLDAC